MRERTARVTSARPDFIVDRRGRARKRPEPRGKGLPVLTAGLAASLIAVAPMTGPGERLMAAARNAAEVIAARSPGLRQAANLIKTKTPPAARPHRAARVLPRMRPAAPRAFPAAPPAPAPIVLTGGEFLPAFPAILSAPVALAETGPCPCGGFAFVPGLSGGGGGLVVIGGGGGGGGAVVPPPPGPPPAVPEPSRWAMMIAGFTMAGWAWRRRRVLIDAVRGMVLLFYTPAPLLAHVRRD